MVPPVPLAHHRHTQDLERDPELRDAKSLTRARYALVLTGAPYWLAQARVLSRGAAGRVEEPWIPPARRAAVVAEARVYLTLYGLLAAWSVTARSALPLLLWIGPVLLGQPVLRAVLLAEHTGCPILPDRLVNTRTTLDGRLFGLLFWNANCHAEHHLAPSVPFHALPKLHALVRPRLGAVEPSYPAAHRSIRAGLAGSG